LFRNKLWKWRRRRRYLCPEVWRTIPDAGAGVPPKIVDYRA